MSYCVEATELLDRKQGDHTEKLDTQVWYVQQLKDGHLFFVLLIDILLTEVFDLILHIILASKLLQDWMGRKDLKESDPRFRVSGLSKTRN